ncbi:MAG TPA: FixH family protein [Alphaproteobacteria bacterium]|nr:FixH family protein [Alphaproteobacteria bacterium]HNS43718.1 FixH family protein [Alphaproteobacteria bacterium]
MSVALPKPLTGKRVLLYMILFFGVVMAVNGYMIFVALKHHPGVVTEHNYERGIAYDETLAQAEFQKKLGWATSFSISGDQSEMVYVIRDTDGKVLEGKSVSVRMVRPVQAGYDFEVKLEGASDGRYHAPFKAPLRGAWDAHITVRWDGGVYYDNVPVVLD